MDKLALKKVIKPLIKECLKEFLVEEGLVKVIKEYNETTKTGQVLKNNIETNSLVKEVKKQQASTINAKQNDLKKSAVSSFGFDIFEGTKPAPKDGESVEDEGVNISSLINENSNSWSQHLGISQRKKA